MNCGFDHHLHIVGIQARRISVDNKKDKTEWEMIWWLEFSSVLFLSIFTNAKNMLTWIIGGVKSTSFFDISKVFPVGGECRGPSESHLIGGESRKCQEGKRGSVANCWLRRT